MDKIHLYDKILSPMVTEKSTNLSEQNKIVFKVPTGANKVNLKKRLIQTKWVKSSSSYTRIESTIKLKVDPIVICQ